MKVIGSYNVPEAYHEAIILMRVWATKTEESRNGPVRVARQVMLEIRNPLERVLFDPVRNENPFFHVMEFVWMMSGSNDVRWIEQFNSRLRSYADEGSNKHHGAYGHRWRRHFGFDQLLLVRDLLRKDPTTRRAVLAMWDGERDFEEHNDLPCNTHIYFAVVDGRLEMTVCNRSNDLIWGMLGANVVHMTLLQELLAADLDYAVGPYRVFTNNLHVYENLPDFEKIWNRNEIRDYYKVGKTYPYPILSGGETMEDFLSDCEKFIHGSMKYECDWLVSVARPIFHAYMDRKAGKDGRFWTKYIEAKDWKVAANEYIDRKELAKDTPKAQPVPMGKGQL